VKNTSNKTSRFAIGSGLWPKLVRSAVGKIYLPKSNNNIAFPIILLSVSSKILIIHTKKNFIGVIAALFLFKDAVAQSEKPKGVSSFDVKID
jgi:hypothetical protein